MRLSPTAVRHVCMYEMSHSADHPDYRILFRMYVSRRAAGKGRGRETRGRAVLEGMRLGASTIEACFRRNPRDVEEAVQEGLDEWCGGKGFQPPTWGALIKAMEYAEFALQGIEGLKVEVGLSGTSLH